MGTIGADYSRVARATTPGSPPQPHGWVRLWFEVSRFPHFWVGGLASAEFSRGVEFRGSLAPFFFSTSLNKRKYERILQPQILKFDIVVWSSPIFLF